MGPWLEESASPGSLGAAKDFGPREAWSAAGAQFLAGHIFCARKYAVGVENSEKLQETGKTSTTFLPERPDCTRFTVIASPETIAYRTSLTGTLRGPSGLVM